MAVKVTHGAVDTGSRIYRTGELIIGLEQSDELDLIKKGVCEAAYLFTPLAQAEQTEGGSLNQPQEGNDLLEGVEKLPGGFYVLPNGEKIRGREKALERLAELEAAGTGKEEGGDPEGGPNTSIPGLT